MIYLIIHIMDILIGALVINLIQKLWSKISQASLSYIPYLFSEIIKKKCHLLLKAHLPILLWCMYKIHCLHENYH